MILRVMVLNCSLSASRFNPFTHQNQAADSAAHCGSSRFLFRSSTSGLLWNGKTLSNWFTAHLKKAEVRHRGANQCRHTFASQMLSSYVPVEWVARQLGHADTTMVRKHYGRWIPKDTKSMAGIVSKMLGFRTE